MRVVVLLAVGIVLPNCAMDSDSYHSMDEHVETPRSLVHQDQELEEQFHKLEIEQLHEFEQLAVVEKKSPKQLEIWCSDLANRMNDFLPKFNGSESHNQKIQQLKEEMDDLKSHVSLLGQENLLTKTTLELQMALTLRSVYINFNQNERK